MRYRRTIWTIIVLIQSCNLIGQRIEFGYDANGNRISRILVVERLESKSVSFPIVNPKNLKSAEKVKSEEKPENKEDQKIQSENQSITALLYPNPTKGLIKIDIANMPLNSLSELRLYDLNGNELIVKRRLESYSEIDINNLKNGIYILRIVVDGKLFDWKVVKSQ